LRGKNSKSLKLKQFQLRLKYRELQRNLNRMLSN